MAFPPLPPTAGPALVGQRVAAAVSGGADSVAMVWWLHDLATRPEPAFVLAGLIHVNHHLRGEASDADARFCVALARRLGVRIEVVDAPVTVTGRSPEAEARRVRYQAFARAAESLSATVVCTAHTADDQVETMLLRLMRGAGLRGVGGIREANGLVVRPLLACRRTQLRDALTRSGEGWREDLSNADQSIPRNRLRHDLLPQLERVAADLAPGAVDAIARFASYAADDEQFLEAAATELAARIVQVDAGHVVIERVALTQAPVALARRVVRQVADQVAGGREWSATHIDAVLTLAGRHQGGGSLDLPGTLVERVSNQIRCSARTDRPETFRASGASD